jgi:hypothetical protein
MKASIGQIPSILGFILVGEGSCEVYRGELEFGRGVIAGEPNGVRCGEIPFNFLDALLGRIIKFQ